MKILIINTVFHKGGAAKIAREIFKFLNYKTENRACFAYGRGRKSNLAGLFKFGISLEVCLHAFLVRFIGIEGFGSYFSTRRLINYLKKEKFELIQMHNLHGYYLDFFKLSEFLILQNIRVVWRLCDEWPLTCLPAHGMGCLHCKTGKGSCVNTYTYPKTYNRLFFNYMLEKKKRCFGNLNNLTIVCPSRWLAERVEESYLGKFEVVTIHNGVDTQLFRAVSDKKGLRKKHNLPADKKIILFSAAGFKEKSKGIDYVIKTAEAFSDGDVLFLGVGNGRLPSAGNIRRFGYVSDEKTMSELYALSDIYLFPSSAETFGIVAVEAMASGLPVVAFDIGPVREIVTDKEGVLVDVGDIRGIKSAVKSILSDDALRKQMGLNARERAEKHFSLEKMLKSYESIYNNAGS